MRAWHTSAHYSTSTGPYVTCGFAIWFAMALFKYWWNNDNYNEIYLKSAPVVQWIMASIIAFGAGSIYDISTRAFSTLSFGLGNFGRNSISGQSLVWGLLISLFVILPNSYVLHCDMNRLPATVWDNADIFDLEMFDFDDLRYEPILRTFDFVNMSPTEFCD